MMLKKDGPAHITAHITTGYLDCEVNNLIVSYYECASVSVRPNVFIFNIYFIKLIGSY
jgi:hypothetical protein